MVGCAISTRNVGEGSIEGEGVYGNKLDVMPIQMRSEGVV